MGSGGEKGVSAAVLTIVALASCWTALAVEVSNRYRSPRNPERAVRASTELIVLHTTEAPARSSLNKLCDRGEAHYCVTEDGTIYAIVDRDREAFHAGRSMWNGKEDVDKFSVGIECVGYHDKPMGIVQLRAIAALVKELKAMYRLGDDRVVCHSHVAYGAPNRWQRHRHRGRKRCGMLFATNTIRKILGLTAKPKSDPDTRAGRLVVGDPYLRQVLYGGVDTMVSHYPKPAPAKPQVAKTPPVKTPPAKTQPAKPQVVKTPPKQPPAKPQPAPKPPPVVQAKKVPRTEAELKSMGYSRRGVISPGLTAMKIAGAKWNADNTYYVVRGKATPGSMINPAKIEVGAAIWMK